MTDLFESWKSNKFVLAPPYVLSGESNIKYLIILSDIGYWVDQADELVEWCQQNNAKTAGMTVELYDEKTLTMFLLKWS